MIRYIFAAFFGVVFGIALLCVAGCSDEVAVNRVDVRVKADMLQDVQVAEQGATVDGRALDQLRTLDQRRIDQSHGADKGTGAGTGTGTGTGAAKGCAKLKECCDKIDAKDFSPKSMCNQLVAAARDDFCDQGYPAYAYFCK